ncbi:hypothetical protein DLAC_11334 [Tieghemostelium lacteum]|uniref:Uncharacterized protein n=1 Tax=Tieghemostelium lacteum TaxID=361077 RepID=A0A151Z3S3_TIELA|nr:hypothetical protein DLAC_11334 [Tieghemostelium lacteum]|eukprot:KYQ88595.1 hypothetical protein DLAC_11334 [Tieghemostelium lacteum]
MYKQSIISVIVLISIQLLSINAFINFIPYSPTDTACAGEVQGFGFGIPDGECVGNSELVDLPGSYFIQVYNDTQVLLNTYINIEFGNDCSGHPTSSHIYNVGECEYDTEGSFDETDYSYLTFNTTNPYPLIPDNSVVMEVYDHYCTELVSYYFYTNQTTIGTENTILFTYYCQPGTNLPYEYSCNDHNKCDNLNLYSDCNKAYKTWVKVYCMDSSQY